MFNPLDDASLFGKKIAGFVSGRGASTTAVAFAAPFVPAAQLPMVGLAVGVPIKAAVSTIEHYHREDEVLNKFRDEIAASFGIDVEDVTHDNLRSLAFGNPKIGIEPQPFFQEILEQNDKKRWIDVGANVAASALTMGFVFSQGDKIAGALSSLASSSGIALFVGNPAAAGIAGLIGLSIAAALVVHAIDFIVTEVCKDTMGIKDKTSYEMLGEIEKQKTRGHEISSDKVMALIANINPALKTEIIKNYGAPYNALPEKQRMAVLEQYADSLSLEENTAKINSGVMKVNELAFIAIGGQSGVVDKDVITIEKSQLDNMQNNVQNNVQIASAQVGGVQTIKPNIIESDVIEPIAAIKNMAEVNVAMPVAVGTLNNNMMLNNMGRGDTVRGDLAHSDMVHKNLDTNEVPQTKIVMAKIAAKDVDNLASSAKSQNDNAQNNHLGMMQNHPMLSQAIH